jgi:predicted nuclease of predicted toxin-antitoxin system
MKFNLDENFASRTIEVFREEGHDIQTVRDEGLCGVGDVQLHDACRVEQRCLVTLDMDFSDPLRFDPAKCGGIVILRLPVNPSLRLLTAMIRGFLGMIESTPIDSALWIVEPGRIRVHRTGEP